MLCRERLFHLAPLLVAAALAGAGGCAPAALITAGTVAGLAASALTTGADVYRSGKLDAVDMARFDDWVMAVRLASADLHLSIDDERLSTRVPERWQCRLRDERGSAIGVRVERRTETLCRCRIDVGLFGSEPTARLILARIRAHLPRPPNPPTPSHPTEDCHLAPEGLD